MDFQNRMNETVEHISKVIVGKNETIRLILMSFVAGGHILLEDLPGLGKTMLVKTISKTIGLPFKRIQFTPDLLPSDLTGIHFYHQPSGEFIFREGPLFSRLVLADEMNRATPRTQSALLEAMEEKQITIDGITKLLDRPFMVLATQNPIETFGTFPLPEAQLDRFAMRLSMGYTSVEEEMEIVKRNQVDPLERLESIFTPEDLQEFLDAPKSVSISDDVLNYLVQIVATTRNTPDFLMGVSPRGSVTLFKIAQIYALSQGRDFIIPEDIKYLAPFVLNHRVILKKRGSVQEAMTSIQEMLKTVPLPTETL